MSKLNKSTINVVMGGAGYVVPMLVNFISTPLLLRLLGDAAYGLQSLVNVIIGYLIVADLGLDIPVTKFVAEDHAHGRTDEINQLLDTTIKVYLVLGLAGMLIIFAIAGWLAAVVFKIPPSLVAQARTVFVLTGIGFFATVMNFWSRAILHGLQRYDISNAVAIGTNLFGVGGGLAAAWLGYGVIGFVSVRILAIIASSLINLWFSMKLLPFLRFKLDLRLRVFDRIKGYAGYSFSIRLCNMVLSRLDQGLIGVWLGVAAVGLYSIPYLIASQLWYLIFNMLSFTFPQASELHSMGRFEELKDLFITASRVVIEAASFIYIPLLVFGDRFLSLWVGERVAAQTSGVMLTLTAAFFSSALLTILSNAFMVGIGRIRQYTAYSLVRTLVLLLGFLFLIKPYGIQGAAWAFLLAMIPDLIFWILTAVRYLELPLGRVLREACLPQLLPGAAIASIGLLLRPHIRSWPALVLALGFCWAAYLGIGFATGSIGRTERQAARGLWKWAASLARGQ